MTDYQSANTGVPDATGAAMNLTLLVARVCLLPLVRQAVAAVVIVRAAVAAVALVALAVLAVTERSTHYLDSDRTVVGAGLQSW